MSGPTIDLQAKYGNTTLSNHEVWMMGEAFWTWVGLPGRMGWTSPAGILDYSTNPAAIGLAGVIMRDFVAWTAGQLDKVEGCEGRMRELAETARLGDELARRADRLLGGGSA